VDTKANPRIVCRFSCGAASAVATKLVLGKYERERIEISYSDPGSEHPDNKRFLADCQRWFDHPITILRSDTYADTWAVWEGEGWLTSRGGSPCTGLLKREPTYATAKPDDILVFGYTVDEKDRAESFRKQNFEITFETPLIEAGLTKADCLAMVERAGIKLPAMYLLGYHNNNCVGCPKGGMGYWNKIRKDFPAVFERMAALQRKMGPASAFFREGRQAGAKRITLDELAPDRGNHDTEPKIECSMQCYSAERNFT
jgi:3'-phosphoadenosine 5'-phosphosulfate sulfotransferase (PAPS reductase)/FAD synthetase